MKLKKITYEICCLLLKNKLHLNDLYIFFISFLCMFFLFKIYSFILADEIHITRVSIYTFCERPICCYPSNNFNHITIIYNICYDPIVCVVKFVLVLGCLRPTWEFFTHLEASLLLVKGCTVWPKFSLTAIEREGSLAYHTYCDTGHPFLLVISEGPWHSHLLSSAWQLRCVTTI